MTTTSNIFGWESGDRADTYSFSGGGTQIAVETYASARTGSYALRKHVTVSSSAGYAQLPAHTAWTANMGVGDQKLGKLRLYIRFNGAHQSAEASVCGFGIVTDLNRVEALFDATGKFRVRIAASATVTGALSATAVDVDKWYRIVVDYSMLGAAGGDLVATVTVVDDATGATVDTSTATVDRSLLTSAAPLPVVGGNTTSITCDFYIDDVWYEVTDGTATLPDISAPCATKIYAVRTTANGSVFNFSNSYASIDEVPLNTGAGDDTCVSTVSGDTALVAHTLAAALVVGAVAAIKVMTAVKASAAANHAIMFGGAEQTVAVATANYTVMGTCYTSVTGWTTSAFDALEWGFKNKTGATVTLGAVTAEALCSPEITAITPATLPDGLAGTAYASQQFAITGGTSGSLSFAIVSGSLPSGLSLTSVGLLSGTPTTVGTYAFSVRATSCSATLDAARTLIVARRRARLLWNAVILADGYDLSGDFTSVSVELRAETVDRTLFGGTTRARQKAALLADVSGKGYWQSGVGGVDRIASSLVGVSDKIVTVFPEGITEGASGVGKGFAMQGVVEHYALGGDMGTLLGFEFAAAGRGIE